MKQTRTVFGLLIMILFAVPILFGVIWAVGFTQAAVSQKTLSQLPGEIIAEIPELLDGMMLAARDENSDMDYETRTWLNAMAGAGTAPRDVMKQTGLSDWLQKELTASLAAIGDILNGRSDARDVWLDMRPLKSALAHPAMENWLAQVLERLPDCTPGESAAWEQALRGDGPGDSLPACRPGRSGDRRRRGHPPARRSRYPRPGQPDGKRQFPPREIQPGQDGDLVHLPAFPHSGRLHRSWGRWSGAAASPFSSAGAAPRSWPAAALSWPCLPWSRASSPGRMRVGPAYSSPHWNPWQDIFADHAGGLALVVSRHFMSPVITVAGAVCVVGLLLFAFSFTFTRENAA